MEDTCEICKEKKDIHRCRYYYAKTAKTDYECSSHEIMGQKYLETKTTEHFDQIFGDSFSFCDDCLDKHIVSNFKKSLTNRIVAIFFLSIPVFITVYWFFSSGASEGKVNPGFGFFLWMVITLVMLSQVLVVILKIDEFQKIKPGKRDTETTWKQRELLISAYKSEELSKQGFDKLWPLILPDNLKRKMVPGSN